MELNTQHPKNLDEIFLYKRIEKINDESIKNYPIYTPYDFEIILAMERIKNYKLFKNKEKN
jgi:hypothetical protein